MNVKWDYTTENDGNTSPVATLYRENGCPVLQVYEGRNSYFSRPCGEYAQHIERFNVTYVDATRFIEKEEENGAIFTESERELTEVEFACTLFESNFQTQRNTILNLLA